MPVLGAACSCQLEEDTVHDEIRCSHALDDLCKDVAALRRSRDSARLLLVDAQDALRAGDLGVVEEFLDRAVGHLSR